MKKIIAQLEQCFERLDIGIAKGAVEMEVVFPRTEKVIMDVESLIESAKTLCGGCDGCDEQRKTDHRTVPGT